MSDSQKKRDGLVKRGGGVKGGLGGERRIGGIGERGEGMETPIRASVLGFAMCSSYINPCMCIYTNCPLVVG